MFVCFNNLHGLALSQWFISIFENVRKPKIFLAFSGDIEVGYWPEIALTKGPLLNLVGEFSNVQFPNTITLFLEYLQKLTFFNSLFLLPNKNIFLHR